MRASGDSQILRKSWIMKTFIVHIYGFKKNDPRSLLGVAEEVGSEGKRAFTNPDDLLKIMIPKEIQEEIDANSPS
jgi:hypothetical protein